MARIFIDGFESGDFSLWDAFSYNVGSPAVASGISGMSGAYCAKLSYGGTWFRRSLPSLLSEIYVGFLLQFYGSASEIFTFYSLTGGLCWLGRSTGGYLQYQVQDLLVTTTPLPLNTPILMEVRYLPHNTTGLIQIKVNGILAVNYSGDTVHWGHGATGLEVASIAFGNTGGGSNNFYVDDVRVDDANWPGNYIIQKKQVTGAGNSAQLTPSAGSNWQCVDEIPASEADFVHGLTDGLKDDYATSSLTGIVGAVKCLQVQARAKREGAPPVSNLKLLVRSGGADYPSSAQAVPVVSTGTRFNLWETNPATGGTWTEATVNAAKIGVELET